MTRYLVVPLALLSGVCWAVACKDPKAHWAAVHAGLAAALLLACFLVQPPRRKR